MHTCNLITLEAQARESSLKPGWTTGPDLVANEKPNSCTTNKTRMWTEEGVQWLSALATLLKDMGFPGPTWQLKTVYNFRPGYLMLSSGF